MENILIKTWMKVSGKFKQMLNYFWDEADILKKTVI